MKKQKKTPKFNRGEIVIEKLNENRLIVILPEAWIVGIGTMVECRDEKGYVLDRYEEELEKER